MGAFPRGCLSAGTVEYSRFYCRVDPGDFWLALTLTERGWALLPPREGGAMRYHCGCRRAPGDTERDRLANSACGWQE
jgi:hypothetical protein